MTKIQPPYMQLHVYSRERYVSMPTATPTRMREGRHPPSLPQAQGMKCISLWALLSITTPLGTHEPRNSPRVPHVAATESGLFNRADKGAASQVLC